jgi:hypothetical protein
VNDKYYTRGESHVTLGGNDMESGVMEGDSHIVQAMKCNMAWKQVLMIINGLKLNFPTLEYPQKIVIPDRDKRKTSMQEQYSNGKESEAYFPI